MVDFTLKPPPTRLVLCAACLNKCPPSSPQITHIDTSGYQHHICASCTRAIQGLRAPSDPLPPTVNPIEWRTDAGFPSRHTLVCVFCHDHILQHDGFLNVPTDVADEVVCRSCVHRIHLLHVLATPESL